MENAIKGWQYISAIFQRMIDLIEKENLIEPQLIYREKSLKIIIKIFILLNGIFLT